MDLYGQGKNKWRKEDKFRIVMETYTLNEEELSIYCRELIKIILFANNKE